MEIKLNENLDILKSVFNELRKVVLQETGVTIVSVIATGRNTDKYVVDLINDKDGKLDDRGLVSVYPSKILPIMTLLNDNKLGWGISNFLTNDSFNMRNNIKWKYDEWDTSYVYADKNGKTNYVVLSIHNYLLENWARAYKTGVDLSGILKEIFLEMVKDFSDKYNKISDRIFKHIFLTFKNSMRRSAATKVIAPDYRKSLLNVDQDDFSVDMEVVFSIFDLVTCDITDKIIKGMDLEDEIIDKIKKLILNMRPKNFIERIAFYEGGIRSILKLQSGSLIDNLLNLLYRLSFTNTERNLELALQGKNVYCINLDDGEKAQVVRALGGNTLKTEGVEDAIELDTYNISTDDSLKDLDYDIKDVIDSMYNDELAGKADLLVESSDKGRQWYKISNLAIKFSQIEVEAEFMDDRYTKKAVMERAYSLLKDIDRLDENLIDEADKHNLQALRDKVTELINESGRRNIKQEREYKFRYPLGYEG